MPRYVILEHDHPFLHWDLMLQTGDVLRTWRLDGVPATGQSVAATALGPHRAAYLDYEGPVSGGRGSVVAWDRGDYIELVPPRQDVIHVRLIGQRWSGRVVLQSGPDQAGTATFLAD
jgi:hypothetical protein